MGYGFPYHEWDNPFLSENKKTIKIGRMGSHPYIPGQAPPSDLTVDNTDTRVVKAIDYVGKYMKNLKALPLINYRCPIVFYDAR